jgi:diacylglycerol O-acyltransferase / wax synthase
VSVHQPTHSLDRAFLRLQRMRPDAHWDTGGIAYVEGSPPRLEDLRLYVGTNLVTLPMLTHRLEGPARRPIWRPDEDFTLDRHVHEAIADGPADWESTLDAVLGEPLPPDAPWGMWLIHGHASDAFALCYRFQHVCQDGIAAALTFRTLLGGGEPTAHPLPRQPRRGDLLRRTGRAIGLGAKFAFDAFAVPGRQSPASFVPTGKRQLLRTREPLDRLRRIGAMGGGSANDAHLAALAGAMAAWSHEAGIPLPRVSALLPIDGRRHDEEQTWGNRIFAVRLELPLHEASPLRRLELVKAATARAKRGQRRQAIQDLVRFMPDRPTEWYMRRMISPRFTSMVATSVPLADGGSLGPAQVTGAALLPLLPPGHLFGVGLALFGGWAEVSFVADRALPLADRLPIFWSQAVNDLEKSCSELTGFDQ